MNQSNYKSIIPSLCLALLFFAPPTEEKWELRKDRQGIKVYSRSVQGTDIKELRTIMTLRTSLNSVMKLLIDVPACKEWVYRCKRVTELKRPDLHEVFYYEETSVPWPVSNRDLIIHSVWAQDEKTRIVTIHAEGVPDYMPDKDGIVRIRKFKGYWKLTPRPGKLVDVEYTIGVDPAGLLPAWLVNMASAEGPFETNLNLSRMVNLPKYRDSKGIVKEL